jgi:epi-isozizaene synthase
MLSVRSIPKFELPFLPTAPGGPIADEAGLDAWLHSWLRATGFADERALRAVKVWRIPRFVQLTTPRCATEDGGRLKCAWIAWFHAFDDAFDAPELARDERAATELIHPFLQVTARARDGEHAPLSDAGALARVYAELNRWAVEGMSAEWRRVWFDDLDEYVSAYVTEVRHRAAGTVLPPEELLALKRVSMAQRSVLNLLERLVTPELSPTARALVRPTMDIVSDITGAMNDPVSLERERERGDVHNLVLSYMEHEGLTESEAIQRVVAFVGQRCQALEDAIQALPARPEIEAERAKVTTWLECTGQWVRGYHDWLRETGRY